MSHENVIFIVFVTTAIGVIVGFVGGWNNSIGWHKEEAVRMGAALYEANERGQLVFTWKTSELQSVEAGVTNQIQGSKEE